MKIALLKSRLSFRGGLEKTTRHLAAHFSQKGCEVHILTTGASQEKGAVTVAASSKWSLWHYVRFNRACRTWLSRHPVDLIFGMERNLFQTHYRLGSGVHRVYLKRRSFSDSFAKRCSLYINPLQLWILYQEKKALENPKLQRLFCNSHMVKEEVLAHFSLPAEKIEVIHNGVEWHAYEAPFQQSFPREKGPYRFLFVGNGYQRKGLIFLLKALPLLSFDFHLTVVGKEKKLPFYRKLCHTLGITDKVSFYGPQPSLTPFYAQTDALVLPTLYDPFANVTLEALAMGLFVITSPFNGGKEVLTPQSGMLIENLFSPTSVAAALTHAAQFPKTYESATYIRNTIKHLSFENQLELLVNKTLS